MTPKSPTVLLIDDSAAVRKSLCTMFESIGFECSESENGAEAVQHAGRLKPDLIVLDFSMPVMNGLEAAPLLKKILPLTPIIMFTLFANPEFAKKAVAAGVTALCGKDEAGHLIRQVESLLRLPAS